MSPDYHCTGGRIRRILASLIKNHVSLLLPEHDKHLECMSFSLSSRCSGQLTLAVPSKRQDSTVPVMACPKT